MILSTCLLSCEQDIEDKIARPLNNTHVVELLNMNKNRDVYTYVLYDKLRDNVCYVVTRNVGSDIAVSCLPSPTTIIVPETPKTHYPTTISQITPEEAKGTQYMMEHPGEKNNYAEVDKLVPHEPTETKELPLTNEEKTFIAQQKKRLDDEEKASTVD